MRVAISGNTYPVKEQLKALGGIWNPADKAWMIPADRAEEARKLVPAKQSNPRRALPAYTGTYRPVEWDFGSGDGVPV